MNKLFRFYSMFIKWYSVVIKWYSMNSIKKISGIRCNSNPNFTSILLVIPYKKHIFPMNISFYARITLNRNYSGIPTSDNHSIPSPNRALSAMRDVLTSDPPVLPPKRRPHASISRRKFKQIKGRIQGGSDYKKSFQY